MKKFLIFTFLLFGMQSLAWAKCPLSDKENFIWDFTKAVAEAQEKPKTFKTLLNDCLDSEVEFSLMALRKLSVDFRRKAVDQCANGKFTMFDFGKEIPSREGMENINVFVSAHLLLSLVESEAVKRKLVDEEDLYKVDFNGLGK